MLRIRPTVPRTLPRPWRQGAGPWETVSAWGEAADQETVGGGRTLCCASRAHQCMSHGPSHQRVQTQGAEGEARLTWRGCGARRWSGGGCGRSCGPVASQCRPSLWRRRRCEQGRQGEVAEGELEVDGQWGRTGSGAGALSTCGAAGGTSAVVGTGLEEAPAPRVVPRRRPTCDGGWKSGTVLGCRRGHSKRPSRSLPPAPRLLAAVIVGCLAWARVWGVEGAEGTRGAMPQVSWTREVGTVSLRGRASSREAVERRIMEEAGETGSRWRAAVVGSGRTWGVDGLGGGGGGQWRGLGWGGWDSKAATAAAAGAAPATGTATRRRLGIG